MSSNNSISSSQGSLRRSPRFIHQSIETGASGTGYSGSNVNSQGIGGGGGPTLTRNANPMSLQALMNFATSQPAQSTASQQSPQPARQTTASQRSSESAHQTTSSQQSSNSDYQEKVGLQSTEPATEAASSEEGRQSVSHASDSASNNNTSSQDTDNASMTSTQEDQVSLTPEEDFELKLPTDADPPEWPICPGSRPGEPDLPNTEDMIKDMDDYRFFHEVLSMYMMIVFTPIAMTIGTTPEIALQLTLKLGLERIKDIVQNTEKPYCGYSPDDVLSDCTLKEERKPNHWNLKELACLTRVYTEGRLFTDRKERLEKFESRHLYKRDGRTLETHARNMNDRPYIAHADNARVAHLYWERRVGGGMKVARAMLIRPRDWRVIEDIMFDPHKLKTHFFRKHLTRNREFWDPIHISTSPEIRKLMDKVDMYYRNNQRTRKASAWEEICKQLFNPRERYLYGTLKRYAISPMPEKVAADYNTEEHENYRLRMLAWIQESTSC